MGKKAKRARRANPRRERNFQNKGNLIELENYRKTRKRRVEIIPRNVVQEDYLEALEDPQINICIATGPAGCGKTWLATLAAIKAFRTGQVEKIVITRPNVAVDDRDIGFLPGDILKKMAPWVKPITDVFEEYYTPKQIESMIEEGLIEICPIAFIRGRTFKNSWILIDEAQGTTPNSMLSILTRIGEGSKMVVTGDLDQSDYKDTNGLQDFLDRFRGSSLIEVIRFTKREVERHPVVKEILRIYDKD